MGNAFDQMAADVLADPNLGKDAAYHSLTDGEVSVTVIVERSVEVMDESGVYTRKAMATLASGLKPRSGDWFEVGAERWTVEAPESDDGYLQRVFVRPKL